jgi:hypothetical protein
MQGLKLHAAISARRRPTLLLKDFQFSPENKWIISKVGHVLKRLIVHLCRGSELPISEMVSFDIHSDNIIMYLFILGMANGFTLPLFEMSPEIQVFLFYFPSIIFVGVMSTFRKIPRICPPNRPNNSDQWVSEKDIQAICENQYLFFLFGSITDVNFHSFQLKVFDHLKYVRADVRRFFNSETIVFLFMPNIRPISRTHELFRVERMICYLIVRFAGSIAVRQPETFLTLITALPLCVVFTVSVFTKFLPDR